MYQFAGDFLLMSNLSESAARFVIFEVLNDANLKKYDAYVNLVDLQPELQREEANYASKIRDHIASK